MKRRWLLLVTVMVFVAMGMVFTINARAKYIKSESLPVTVSIGKQYYVHFDANEGTGTMIDQTFTYGEEQTLAANEFVRDGFNFIGWNRVVDGGTEGDFYEDEEAVMNLTNIGEETVTLYAQWEEEAMHTIFEMDGLCVFHGYDIQQGTGDGHITGNGCIVNGIDWADGTHTYIDTGIKLYNEENYNKDYEIGFTIVEYDPDHQYHDPVVDEDNATQTTFVNAKLEDSSRHWPGLAIRKNSDKIEIVQTITDNNGKYEKKTKSHSAATTTKVTVARVDGVVYYSFNDDPFDVLQDINGTEDYFDTNVWFGAAERSDGAPKRYLDATLTNLYIKIGDTGANKHTVSFDARGVTSDPQDVVVISSSKIGNALPSMGNYGGYYFGGWYTQEDGEGTLVTRDYVVDQDMTLYAYWRDNNDACRVGDETKNTIQECVDLAGASDTVILQRDLAEQVINIASGKEMTIDLGGHTLSDNNVTGQPVIANSGKVTIINGTMTSSMRAGVINNNPGAELYIKNDAKIIATGSRQAIYNGGELVISDNAYLSNSSSERAAVHNYTSTGAITIKGGTIISLNQQGVNNAAGTLVIGELGGGIHADAPVIQGATYGVTTTSNITMYDGVLKGRTAAIDNAGRITTTEPGSTVVGVNPVVTEIINGVTYKILYYQ